jgi:MFS family permease
MVGKADLMNAIALNSSMFNASRVAGPAIAGVTVAAIGEGWCFFANGASYIAVIAGLLLMRVKPFQPAPRQGSPLKNIADGFRFVVQNAPVNHLLALLGVVNLAGMPFTVLMPAFADRILHGGPKALGYLMGATGVGAICAALLLAARRNLAGLGRWAALASTSFSIWLVGFAFSRVFWLSALILVPVGFSMVLQMGATNTLIQSMVPDRLRGRVMSIYSMTMMGMAPFGSLFAGYAAAHLGPPRAVAVGAAVCLIASLVFWMRLPRIRVAARRLIMDQNMDGQSLPAEHAIE